MTDVSGEAATGTETQDRDFESEATKQGWRPKDEWTGAPEHWKDAKTYVEHGDIKSQIAKIEREHRAEIDGLKKVNSNTVALLKRQYDSDIASIKAAQKIAAKAGDDKEYDRLEAVKSDLKAPEPAKSQTPDEAFKERNEWYGSDKELTRYAIGVSNTLVSEYAEANKGATMPLQDMMDATEKEVKTSKLYKDKFTKTPTVAAVDGGSNEPPPNKSDPLARHSAEVRNQAKDDMKRFPKIYPDAQSWLRTYEGKK